MQAAARKAPNDQVNQRYDNTGGKPYRTFSPDQKEALSLGQQCFRALRLTLSLGAFLGSAGIEWCLYPR